MKNNYIDTIIKTWEKFNNNEYEIFVYSINDLIEMMNHDINEMIIDDADDIKNKNQLLQNVEYCKTINDNYHIVIDTPCDDDMLSIIHFDKNYNIIGFGYFQTTWDEIYCTETKTIYAINDCMQFFHKIDITGLLRHIYDKWEYKNHDNNVFDIPCETLSNILKIWLYLNNKKMQKMLKNMLTNNKK